MSKINPSYFKAFEKALSKNGDIDRVPAVSDLEELGCDISGIGYLVAPDKRQFNPKSFSKEALPEELHWLFFFTPEEQKPKPSEMPVNTSPEPKKKKGLSNKDAAILLGIDEGRMSGLRLSTGISTRGALKESDIDTIRDFLKKNAAKRKAAKDEMPEEEQEPIGIDPESIEELPDGEEEFAETNPLHSEATVEQVGNAIHEEMVELAPGETLFSLPDDEQILISVGQIKEIISHIESRKPKYRVMNAKEVLHAIGA